MRVSIVCAGRVRSFVVLCALAAAVAQGCGGETAATPDGGKEITCGAGTVAADGGCLPAGGGCAAGTLLKDGVCVAACTEGEVWNGSTCVSAPACAAGTSLDSATKKCVPACADGTAWDGTACVEAPFCGPGTVHSPDAGACVPVEIICGEGTIASDGGCVPVLTCGAGTHLENGACVKDELPQADVTESSTDGTAAGFSLPAAGGNVVLGGLIDLPADKNADGAPDGDWDSFTFDAPAGTWLRLTARSDAAALTVFIVQSAEVDANSVPIYLRYALNPVGPGAAREVYLPRDGEYLIVVSDYANMMIDVFGSGIFPVGGPAFTYTVSVENLGTPQAQAVDTLPLADTGNLGAGALRFFTLKGMAVRDLIAINSPARPVSDRDDDVLPGWMLFAPSGGFVREVMAASWDKDAAATMVLASAGDHLLVGDFLMSVGPLDDFAIGAVREPVVDCSASSCAAASLAAGDHVIWSFDLSAGEMLIFGATVPAGATENLRVNFLDESYNLISEASAGATWSRSDHVLAETDTWVYLYVSGWTGAAVPDYSLEHKVFAVPALPRSGVLDGVAVHALPDAALSDSGFVRFEAKAGELVVVPRFVLHDSTGLWTAPAQSFVEKTFTYLGPALDTTDAALAPLAPNMALIQADGTYLHRAHDSNSTAIAGATYDLTIAKTTPHDLGAPAAGTPVAATDKALDAETSAAYFVFTGVNGAAYDVAVTPKTAGLQPSAAVFATGFHYQTTWYSSPGQKELGRVTKTDAQNPGDATTATVTTPYAGKLLIVVTDTRAAAPADLFDVRVAVKN